jgi:hypothetical protein
MMYKANVAVCSDIRTKHSKQSEYRVEFLNVKPWWYVEKPLGFKRLMQRWGTDRTHPLSHSGFFNVSVNNRIVSACD